MEGKNEDGSERSLAERVKNDNQVPFSDSDKNDIPIQELVTSESKTPLKTPVRDEDEVSPGKFNANEGLTEVNGDAKIDIHRVKDCFSGMSKEELLQYVNDPFWVRTRMFLFIFFLLAWIAMLVGAITIIIVAPKCEPPKWHNQGPLYDVDIPTFLNSHSNLASGLFNEFVKKFSYLNELNVRGLIMSPIFKTDGLRNNDEDVIDFKDVDEKYGTLEDFKNLIKEAQSLGIHVLLSLVPNHSSNKHVWFNKSIAREAPYDDYYIWAPSPGSEADGSKMPPNNWLSLTGGSAWEWNEERQEFYLHQFDVNQPDLNFRNPDVIREINETLNFWLNLGVSGFNLKKGQYLLEDKDLENEQISRTRSDAVHTDYDFYYHSKTYNLPDNAAILTKWREIVHLKLESDGVLTMTGEPPIPSDGVENVTLVDIVRNDRLSDLPRDFTVNDLYQRLKKLVVDTDEWPAFQVGDAIDRAGGHFQEEDLDGLNIITLLIRGTPIILSGEELGIHNKPFPWANETDSLDAQREAEESHFKIFKALLKARESKSVVYGSSNLTILNDSMIALTRIKAGNPGYLAVYNLGTQNETVDFTSIEHVPNELQVYAMSMNYADDSVNVKSKVTNNDFLMTPRSAVVFTFVPNIEEGN
ncbi:UNVERIFIED_CONTAM: hypothetical protein PYX00_000825 [Menopon gallinae]|uniref:alpha-glucosidase n=1 Tax=Menopon gallinae TaxID=328185 RepID=A0AAW2ICN3_9NEOP